VSEKIEEQAEVVEEMPVEASSKAKASVNKGSLIVLGLIVLSLFWYLLADRFTPYTTQARVQGYVVGVAPKVAGVLTNVWIQNNQVVDESQQLFEIDPSQYRIAVEKARSDLETARRQVDAGSSAVEAARAGLLAAKANEEKAE